MTQQPGGSGPDLIGDFQRWLVRSSARGVGRQVSSQIRSALGRNQPTGDVWESATADPSPVESPECAWCPLCRAARVLRESKPSRDNRVTAVSDALGTVVQDAFSVLEAALAATGRAAAGDGRRAGASPQPARTGRPEARQPQAASAGRPGAAQPGPDRPSAAGTGQPATDQPAAGPAGQDPAGHPAAEQGMGGAASGQQAGQGLGAGLGAEQEPGGAGTGPAEQGLGGEPEAEPPGGSVHEPDDRG